MRNRKTLLSVLLLLALLLSACGSSAAPAADLAEVPEELAAEAAPEKLPDEPYEAVEYSLYPSPEGGYVGDVMPFVTDDGTLELYYLYDTDNNGQGYHPIYKYSTKNLYEYEDHGKVLDYGQMSDPDPALGTGSVLQDADGLYHLFYTGHNDTGNGGKGKECVMHATSTDRENWVKDGVVFYAPDNYSKDDFRDPEVFWVEEDHCYWLLIAARENTLGGVVVKYTSPDLQRWDFVGPIFAPMSQYMLECPDLFCIGDTWYLTYSWDCVTYYAMSDSMGGPFVAPKDNILDGKGLAEGNGFIFYAGKTAEFNGKLYLCGWLGRAGLSGDSGFYQWAGSVMNHELVQREDKTLGVKAPEILDEYYSIDKLVFAAPLAGEVEIDNNNISLSAEEGSYALADLGTRPAAMTLECDVKMEEDSYQSANVCVRVTKEYFTEIPAWIYVADIYISDISCLKTAFGKDTYGRGYIEWISDVARRYGSVVTLNGDYYGTRDTGVVIRNGTLYRDNKTTNDIAILYWDGRFEIFKGGKIDAKAEMANGAYQSWCFGPALMDGNGKPLEKFNCNDNLTKKNPRSAIGYYEPGHYCFLVVDGRNKESRGASMEQLAGLMEYFGCKQGYNLDGGQTSLLAAGPDLINRPSDGGRNSSDYILIVDRVTQ